VVSVVADTTGGWCGGRGSSPRLGGFGLLTNHWGIGTSRRWVSSSLASRGKGRWVILGSIALILALVVFPSQAWAQTVSEGPYSQTVEVAVTGEAVAYSSQVSTETYEVPVVGPIVVPVPDTPEVVVPDPIVIVPEYPPPPTEEAPAEPAPTDPTPSEPTPSEPTPPEPAPTEPTPTEPTPSEPPPVEPPPVEPTPSEPVPSEPMPSEPAPTEPAPSQPTTPVEPTPVEPTPVEPTPVEPTPGSPVPEAAAPIVPAPQAPVAVEQPPVEASPVEAAPVEPPPVQPSETKPPEVSPDRPDSEELAWVPAPAGPPPEAPAPTQTAEVLTQGSAMMEGPAASGPATPAEADAPAPPPTESASAKDTSGAEGLGAKVPQPPEAAPSGSVVAPSVSVVEEAVVATPSVLSVPDLTVPVEERPLRVVAGEGLPRMDGGSENARGERPTERPSVRSADSGLTGDFSESGEPGALGSYVSSGSGGTSGAFAPLILLCALVLLPVYGRRPRLLSIVEDLPVPGSLPSPFPERPG